MLTSQVNVRYVSTERRWAIQYAARDDCTRFRVLRLCRQLSHGSRLAFLLELGWTFPFPINWLQSDHGQESSFTFVPRVEAAGIRYRHLKTAGLGCAYVRLNCYSQEERAHAVARWLHHNNER